jgi:hypothetical protein
MTPTRFAVLGLLFATHASVMAASIRVLPDLQTVTIYEITFSTVPNAFAPNAAALTTRLGNPLTSSNNDFSFTNDEHYDVFYSNADGSFNPDGAFITIEAIWTQQPQFGSMNINEVQLAFGGASPHQRFGDFVSSFVYGSNCTTGNTIQCDPGSEAKAVDHDLSTYPRFGATSPADSNERMRLTIGFEGISPIPEPSTWALFACGLVCVAGVARRAQRTPSPR